MGRARAGQVFLRHLLEKHALLAASTTLGEGREFPHHLSKSLIINHRVFETVGNELKYPG
jgi:hypothetical protein